MKTTSVNTYPAWVLRIKEEIREITRKLSDGGN
jgi:hypothetical protein